MLGSPEPDSAGPVSLNLQFDRAVSDSRGADSTSGTSATCSRCHAAITDEYYSIDGNTLCAACRTAVEAEAEVPRGAGPFIRAGVFGLGAGIAGAAIYYAVIAITNFEIGLVALLIGYMVGWAVRKGARGRGGRRFQILAVALTYGAVAWAYAPIIFTQAAKAQKTPSATASTAPTPPSTETSAPAQNASAQSDMTVTRAVGALFVLVGVIFTLPLFVVFGTLPSGAITAIIMFVGMRRAWSMTAAPVVQVYGPYRVGASVAPAST